VLGGAVQTWMLFVLAAVYGVADGFFFPAQTAIVPQLAALDQLSVANAFIQGPDQVAQFVGPVLAGVLIASVAAGRLGLQGLGVALAVDAATFVASVALLATVAPVVAAAAVPAPVPRIAVRIRFVMDVLLSRAGPDPTASRESSA